MTPMETVEKSLRRISFAAAAAAAAAVLAIVLLIVAEIVLRSLFGRSLHMVEEYSGYLVLCVLGLATPLALLDGALLRVEFIVDSFAPTARRWVQVGYDVLCLMLSATFAYYLATFALRSFSRGTVAPTQMMTPLYLPQACVAFGFALLSVCFAVKLAAALHSSSRARVDAERKDVM